MELKVGDVVVANPYVIHVYGEGHSRVYNCDVWMMVTKVYDPNDNDGEVHHLFTTSEELQAVIDDLSPDGWTTGGDGTSLAIPDPVHWPDEVCARVAKMRLSD